jgi:hypothetical protein
MTNKRSTKKDELVSLKRKGYTEQNYTGEAYAFFDSPQRLTNEDLRPETSDMVIDFARGEKNFLNGVKANSELREAVRANRDQIKYFDGDTSSQSERITRASRARAEPFQYGIRAKFGQTDRDAADQLVNVVSYIWGKYTPGNEPLRAAILYKDNRERYINK